MIERLHGLAAEVAEVIGEERALHLLMQRGGRTVEVPAQAEGSTLEALVGLDAAEALCDHFGVGQLQLPCAHLRGQRGRRARGVRMLLDGCSVGDVALACDVHHRTAKDWRQGLVSQGALGGRERQLRLAFDDD